ncbi:SAM-dependent methyltransferase [Bradyrhizobium sp. LB7.2]
MNDPTKRTSGLVSAETGRSRTASVGAGDLPEVLNLLEQRFTALDARLGDAERQARAEMDRLAERIGAIIYQQTDAPLAEIRGAAARLEQDERQRYAVAQTSVNTLGERLDRIDATTAGQASALAAAVARMESASTVEMAASARDTLARIEADSAARYEAVQGAFASLVERLDRLDSGQARRAGGLEAALQRMEAVAAADHDAIARIEADAGRRFEALSASRTEVVSATRRLERLMASSAFAPAAPIPNRGSEWVDLDITARMTAKTQSLRAIVADAGLTAWAQMRPIRIRNDLDAPSALAAANSAIADFLADRARLSADERLLWIIPSSTNEEISNDEAEQIFGLLGCPETILRATVDGRGMLLVAGSRRREEILPLLRWSAQALDLAAGGGMPADAVTDDFRRCLVPVFDLPAPAESGDPSAWAERAALIMDRFGAGAECLYGITMPLAALDEPSSLDRWLAALRSALGEGARGPLLQWVRETIPVARSGQLIALAERLGVTFELTATTRDISGSAFAAYDDLAAYHPMRFDLRLPSPVKGSIISIARRDAAAGATDDAYAGPMERLAARLRRVLRRDVTHRFSQAVATEPSLMAGQWELHYIYNWRAVADRFIQAVVFDAELDLADATSPLARAEAEFGLLNAAAADPKTIAPGGRPPADNLANRDLQIAEHGYLTERLVPSADSLRLASWLPNNLGETLELGSGYGVLAEHFLARTSRYVGIDLTLAQGKAIRGLGGLPLIADMHILPLQDARFDTVIADNVIEHATDPVASLKEMRRVLKPGGRGYLVVPLDYLGPDYRNPCHHWKADVDSILSAIATADLQVVRHEVCVLPAIGAIGSFPSCNQRTSLWEVRRPCKIVSGSSRTLDFRAETRAIDPTFAALAERTSEEIVALNAKSQLDGLARKSPSLKGFDWSSYIRLSELRFTRVGAHLARRGAAGRVLDLGAYFGNLSLLLARSGWTVTALDSYAEYGEAFSRHLELMRSERIDVCDFETIGFDLAQLQAESFDAVCCMGVIEHIAHTPRLLLAAIDRVLKPGGWIVLDTPNLAYDYQRSKLAAGRSIFAPLTEQFETDIPFEGHHREYTPSEVRWMMERIGYKEIAIELFIYSSFGLSTLVGDDLVRFEAMEADPERRELIMAVARKADRA